jgi:hypothetical protein
LLKLRAEWLAPWSAYAAGGVASASVGASARAFPTHNGCATSLLSRHSVESLPVLFSELARAARDAQSIKVGKGPCQSNGGNNCAIVMTFQGL